MQLFLTLLSMCLPSPDQRVASFCTLTDMHPEQDLEGAQELPLCVDPGSSKDFMDPAGYVTPVVCLLPMSRPQQLTEAQPRAARKLFHLSSPSPEGPREGTEQA